MLFSVLCGFDLVGVGGKTRSWNTKSSVVDLCHQHDHATMPPPLAPRPMVRSFCSLGSAATTRGCLHKALLVLGVKGFINGEHWNFAYFS